MFNKFKSIFTPKKQKKQNLKYSPYERKSPRILNKIKEANDEQKPVEVAEFEFDKPISKNSLINEKQDEKFIEKEKKVTEKENINIKKVEDKNEVQNSNVIKEVEINSLKDKKEEKKKMDVEDETKKSKRIKLNTFHYYGTGYSRNSQPYLSARKLQTKKSSVLFYKKKLTNVDKENLNTIKSVPEISNTAKLIFEVVEKEENKYKNPLKMKKLEKKSKSISSEKKNVNNNESEAHNKKTNLKNIKRITPENFSKQTDLHFTFVRQSSSYASHPDILVLTKKLSSDDSILPKFSFERKSSSYSFYGSDDGEKPKASIGKKDSSLKSTTLGFNWAAAGMTKPTLAADEWKCSVCDAKNKNTDDKCVCCEEPNPNKKSSDKPKEPPKFTFGSSSGNSIITFGKPAETKTDNKSSETKSDDKPTLNGFNWAAAGMTKPTLAADEWKCSVCDAKNKNTDDKCVCCEEPNPNKKSSDKPKEPPKFTFGSSSGNSIITFGKPAETKTDNKSSETKSDDKPTLNGFNWAAAGMTKPTLAADEWKCSVCDAKNKNTDDKCVCCEEPNPNKKVSDKPKEPSKFTFGSSSSIITFGSTNNSSAITFGQSNNSTFKTTSGFGFGQPFGSAVNGSSNTFTFGNATTSTSSSKPKDNLVNDNSANDDIKRTTTGFSFSTSNSKSSSNFSSVNTSSDNSKK
ncbi:hypothetical protein H8356DRAFT_1664928 [Neocallimastix lanati (nom. inval.)]|nr:hypothetical protein H8356DRAFT_1664928 [Neocallimastix sp. JGI-2020a]